MIRPGIFRWLVCLVVGVLVVGGVSVSVGVGGVSAVSVVPVGFTDTLLVSGLARPYQMEFAPDGRLFVSQQAGRLRVVKNGVLLAEPFVTVAVDFAGDRGLIGVAFDPNFAVNQFVYVYYTTPSPVPHNRVSRFTAAGDVAVPGSEQVLIELDNLGASTIHNGGSIHFGADGKLYIATGENAQGSVAQSLGNLFGKMLRLNADGSIPLDNPFFGTATGNRRAIWALGLRNPFTFGVQPGTGRMLINDVGASAWEEINDGVRGANYGWPVTEGPTADPRFEGPLSAYRHGSTDTTGCAITGGSFYNPPVVQFPSRYVGRYFFADVCGGWIRVLDPATGVVEPFLTGGDGLIDVKTGPDGSLYYLSRLNAVANPGTIHKVTFSGRPAIASPPVGQTVLPGQPATFQVTATGTQPITYQWQRGGVNIAGATGSSFTLQGATLADNGAQFRVVVTNPVGTVTSANAVLTVTTNRAPTATIVTPGAGTRYNAGQTISFTGSANDAEDGVLPASAFGWTIAFHHNTHTHSGPGVGPGPTGDRRSGSFVVPATGETATDVFYRIHLTVTDSGGRTTHSFVDVSPNIVTVSFNATPATAGDGLQITLDGQPHLTPYIEDNVVGMKREIGALSPQVLNGTTFLFDRWSDGGQQTHQITVPATPAGYTAIFTAPGPDPIPPTVSVTSPTAGATVAGIINLTATATDNVGVSAVKWYVDNIEVAYDADGLPWSQPWATTSVPDGPHTIFAKASDRTGNWGASMSFAVIVRNAPTPPIDTSITFGPTATSDTTPDFGFGASVAGSTFACRVDAAAFAPCTSPVTLPVQAQGSHTFAVRATNPSGTTDPTPATRTFVVDTIKAVVSTTSPVGNAVVTGIVTLGANATDAVGVVMVKWYVDNVEVISDGNGAPWSKPWNTVAVPNGPHKIFSKASDAAGNWGASLMLTITVANP